MKSALTILALVLLSANASAAVSHVDVIARAVSCETKAGNAAAVLNSVKALGGKPDKEKAYAYRLPKPIQVLGLPVRLIVVTPGSPELGVPDDYFGAGFEKIKEADVVKAAGAAPDGLGYYRRAGKHGSLAVGSLDKKIVWLSCNAMP